TLWQPGKAFCDQFYLSVTGEVQPGKIYPIVLTLYDYDTQQNLPSTNPDGSESNLIGYVRTRSDLTYTSDEIEIARFGGVHLLNEQRTDTALQLTWGVEHPPARGLKTFVHIIDANGEIAAQVDVTTGGDNYPAWAWNAGEKILDTILLPLDQLPAGTYRILLGVYDPQTMMREAASLPAGTPLTDNALNVGQIEVP
ncbi:MAG: hypothetical protein H7X77_01330, partial [Anaerolineae bacterium]|nr:hypothetical protein [Anaerolineae bacterium]